MKSQTGGFKRGTRGSWRLVLVAAGLLLLFVSTAQAVPGVISRVSTSSSGVQGNADSLSATSITGDGRYVVFHSLATNFRTDNKSSSDIFRKDTVTGQVLLLSSTGFTQSNGRDWDPFISPNGDIIVWTSLANNLASGDTNGVADIFARNTINWATVRVSTGSSGNQGNGLSELAVVSDNGRVAFHSLASNLVTGDTNGVGDIFVKDMSTGATSRVSVSSAGAQGNGNSGWNYKPAITPDGRYVVYNSEASNLVSGDTNGFTDIFIRDTQVGTTTRVSTSATGEQANYHSLAPSVSSDGRFVVFKTRATNLVPGGTNGTYHIFVKDMLTGEVTMMDTSATGSQANGTFSGDEYISPNGRFVAFSTDASNLVPNDTNGTYDLFVKDRVSGAIVRVSVGPGGVQGNNWSVAPSLSNDGQRVAFTAKASNLVPNDTNNAVDIFLASTS